MKMYNLIQKLRELGRIYVIKCWEKGKPEEEKEDYSLSVTQS
jgi:hypothetical protein